MLEYHDFAQPQARPRTQLDAMIGINYFYFGRGPGTLEGSLGWRLGALYSFRDQTIGAAFTPLIPGIGLRAPLGEDLYFDAFATPLVDGFTAQNGHRGRAALRLKGSAGLLYHYDD